MSCLVTVLMIITLSLCAAPDEHWNVVEGDACAANITQKNRKTQTGCSADLQTALVCWEASDWNWSSYITHCNRKGGKRPCGYDIHFIATCPILASKLACYWPPLRHYQSLFSLLSHISMSAEQERRSWSKTPRHLRWMLSKRSSKEHTTRDVTHHPVSWNTFIDKYCARMSDLEFGAWLLLRWAQILPVCQICSRVGSKVSHMVKLDVTEWFAQTTFDVTLWQTTDNQFHNSPSDRDW